MLFLHLLLRIWREFSFKKERINFKVINRKLGNQEIWLTEAASPTIFHAYLWQCVRFTFYMSQLKPRDPKFSNRIERNQLEEWWYNVIIRFLYYWRTVVTLTSAIHKVFISQIFSVSKVHDELCVTQKIRTMSKIDIVLWM